MEEKKKVLFLVYRTEWWGCFEGYCRQECGQKDILCYVMPVPRYKRDDITYKANFGKVCFNPEKLTSLLPEGACLVDWQNFSMEQDFERIYIHNPYENGSLVDTVELKYYASSLKRHTKKLIYVSHLLELIPEEYANCKAYDYVDAIYVPSGRSRFSLDVKYDNKIEVVPSGLPAYLEQLAARTKKGQAESARMKLLYCVSYSDLYLGTEKQLQKMSEIFDYVKRNPDIQLIFRPDEDICARRQMLDKKIWKGYERLVVWFKKERIGIYDDLTGLYEAAVEADGIMSRNHPMNILFSVQGKPVLQVDLVKRPSAPSREDRCTPMICGISAEEMNGQVELLFVPRGTRLICRMVIPGGDNSRASIETVSRKHTEITVSAKRSKKKHLLGPKVEVLAEVPDEIIGGLNYSLIRRRGNCLYLIPCGSDGIWKYDMDVQYISKAYLPNAIVGPVSAAFWYDRYLYMTPSAYPGIVKYDTETEEIVIIDGWVREMEDLVSGEPGKGAFFSYAVVQEEYMLYMASSKGDVWMEFDMRRDKWQLRRMNLSGKRFVHMVKDGDWVWLFPCLGDEIILWNCISGEGRVVYTSKNLNKDNGAAPYMYALDLGTSVVAFPQRETDHVLVIPKHTVFSKWGTDSVTANSTRAELTDMQRQREMVPGFSGSRMEAGLLEEGDIKKIREGIPCGPRDCTSEYRRQIGCGYQFIERLESGLILAYEYYGGTFLLLDSKLNQIRRIPCRLSIETVRQQLDVMWKNARIRYGYSGQILESSSIPVMLEFFVRHGHRDREKVLDYYRKYYQLREMP